MKSKESRKTTEKTFIYIRETSQLNSSKPPISWSKQYGFFYATQPYLGPLKNKSPQQKKIWNKF